MACDYYLSMDNDHKAAIDSPIEITIDMVRNDVTPEIKSNPTLFLRVIEQKFLYALEKKEEGNERYKRKEYQTAIISYKEGLLVISFENFKDIDSVEIRAKIIDVFSKMLNNVSQCFIALERWDEALDVCDKVMRLDPADLKSYYRAGLCLKNQGRLKESFARLEEGSKMAKSVNLSVTPEYVTLKNEIAKQITEDLKKEKEMYGRIFNPNTPKAGVANKSSFRNPIFFPIVSGLGGVCSYFAMNAWPPTQSLKEEEKIAVSASVGAGLGGMASSDRGIFKVLSFGAVLGGAGYVAYKVFESQK